MEALHRWYVQIFYLIHLTPHYLIYHLTPQSALGGYSVIVCDVSDEANKQAYEEMVNRKWGLKNSVKRGKLDYDQVEAAIERVGFTTKIEELVCIFFGRPS